MDKCHISLLIKECDQTTRLEELGDAEPDRERAVCAVARCMFEDPRPSVEAIHAILHYIKAARGWSHERGKGRSKKRLAAEIRIDMEGVALKGGQAKRERVGPRFYTGARTDSVPPSRPERPLALLGGSARALAA